jgi:hypothetical protein
MKKCPKVRWSGFQTPFEIQTKKVWISNGKISLDHFVIKTMFIYEMVWARFAI